MGSIHEALTKSGIEFVLSNDIGLVTDKTSFILLPGVSSFDIYINSLKKHEFFYKLKNLTLSKRIKLIGICSGAQVLFEYSEEGSQEGLGLLPGNVQRLASLEKSPVPHIGWNNIKPSKKRKSSLYIEQDQPFYFCHSYRFPKSENTIAYTDYGERFPAIVSNGQVTAIQFHPEKSYSQGLELLRNIISKQHVKTKNNTSITTI